jgi:hypothetical protein
MAKNIYWFGEPSGSRRAVNRGSISVSAAIPDEIQTKTGRTYPVEAFSESGYLTIVRRWPCGANQSSTENKSYRSISVCLPRKITDSILPALGLLEGEMTKPAEPASSLDFTNTDPALINEVMAFFFRFAGVGPWEWRWCLTFNYKLLCQETQEQTAARERAAFDFWTRNTEVLSENARPKTFNYTGNRQYENMRASTARQGALRLCYPNLLLNAITLALLRKVKSELPQNPEASRLYLKGLFAAEGHVDFTQTGALSRVDIGSTDPENRELFPRILRAVGTTNIYLDKGAIEISGLENFLRLYQLGIFDLSLDKKARVLRGLLSYRYFRNRINPLRGRLRDELRETELKIRERGSV